MLSFLRRGQRWLTALIVAGVGVVFAMFIGLGGPLTRAPASTVVVVGPYQFGFREFERARAEQEARIQQAAGDAYDPDQYSDALDDLAARTLVDRGVLALEARELGLTVSQEEIERSLLASGVFRTGDGRFDVEEFESYVEYEWGSQRAFLEDQERATLAVKMIRLLYDLAAVSEAEARESLRRRNQEVRIAFVAFDPAEAADTVEVEEARIDAFLAEREQEARDLYASRPDRYDVPEQVRARHVLVRVPPDADEAQEAELEQKAQGLLEEIRGGADFAELAREHSDDPGSKEAGGDLGFFRRGQMVAPFEEAAFSREPGSVGDLVRSEFGFHVIRVEEKREAQNVAFEDVRRDLAREILGVEVARQLQREQANLLAGAVREGSSLEAAARAGGLTLDRTAMLRRRPDGYIPGLGASREALATAFALEPGQSSSRIFEVGDKLALIQLMERKEPEPAEIEAGLEAERERLLANRRNAIADVWISRRRTQLQEAGKLDVDLAAVRR